MTRSIGKGLLTKTKPLRRSTIRAHPPRVLRIATPSGAALKRADKTLPEAAVIVPAVAAATAGVPDKADAIAPLEEWIEGAAR